MMLPASNEQLRAARLGEQPQGWEEIDRLVGEQGIPDWCKGADIDWMDGWGNSPSVTFKSDINPYDWPGLK